MGKTTQAFTQFITDTRFEDLPAEVIQAAKMVMLDCLGITVAGARETAGKIIADVVKEMGGREEASVIGNGFRTSVLNAALANGVMAHALDFDDGGHANLPLSRSVAVLPAALALGEATDASGRDVLLAYIIGFDVISKISDGLSGHHHYEWGWQTTGTVCALGAVAAGAKILNLNREATGRALGIGGSGAGGLRQNNGTMTKPLHAGNAARNGVLAALLAKKGFTGTDEVLEGEFGFCHCFCGAEGYDLDRMTEGLGTRYEFVNPGVGIKRYPACMSNHRSLDAVFNIMEENDFSSADITKVECGVNREVMEHLFYLQPQRGLEGKFCLPYCVAVALLEKKVGLRQFTDEHVREPEILDFMKKIHVFEHPDTISLSKKNQFSEITVHLADGRQLSNRVTLVRGRPGNPLAYQDVVAKYRECAGVFLPESQVDTLLDMVENIEQLKEISLMTAVLRG